MKTVIIGGVAGGATTAARLRRKDEKMQIVMFEKGDYISYANCGLPYYIGDKIKSREALLLQTPEAMKKKFRVDVRTGSEVIRILPEEKKVLVKEVKTEKTYEETYDFLVLATGSSPLKPGIPGIEDGNIFTLWSVPDTDAIKTFLKVKAPKHAAVIGGGFIGLEMAENLHAAGLKVSVIEMQNQVMAPLDFEMANLLHENLRMNGVNLILGDGVKAFEKVVDITPEENGGGGKQERTRIRLNSGEHFDVDMVILSIGVRPNNQLANEAHLTVGERGSIVVDETLKTSGKDIFAVGDVIEVAQFVTGEAAMIPLAGPANRQARILADNLAFLAAQSKKDDGEASMAASPEKNLKETDFWQSGLKRYRGSLGTAVAKVFDLNAASVGLNEKQLIAAGKEKNKDYYTVLINQKSHAGYYPGAAPITLKMIFDREGRIYGGQIVGQDGVDKRIDTLAAVMRLKGSIYDLMELELAYAPPFSSAKDPVNMLGFVAENVLSGMVSFVSWEELDAVLADKTQAEKVTVLDVTEDVERQVYSVPGSYHIPLGELRERIRELNPEKKIITYCAIGVRAYNAARILQQNGYQTAVLSGGLSFYKSMHHETGGSAVSEKSDTDAVTANESDDVLSAEEVKILDCSGLQCPGPIMKVYESLGTMKDREILKVSATDMGFVRDIESWCRRTGNTLLKSERIDRENIVYIRKGTAKDGEKKCKASAVQQSKIQENGQITTPSERLGGKTMIVFSGDLDKVLASFIIANGAAAMGRPVTMFFTFWGLNALRKPEGAKVKKTLVEKMFGIMMPKGSTKLKLSKMNMAGMGTVMMRKVMRQKNVDSLETLIAQAKKNGVRMVACTMSMDVMGMKEEELIDGIEYAGVASYLGDAEESDVNLFIS